MSDNGLADLCFNIAGLGVERLPGDCQFVLVLSVGLIEVFAEIQDHICNGCGDCFERSDVVILHETIFIEDAI